MRVAAASLRQSPDGTTTMVVVPRSSFREPPIILSELASPDVTLALAALLLAVGLLAVKAWGRLNREAGGRLLGTGS